MMTMMKRELWPIQMQLLLYFDRATTRGLARLLERNGLGNNFKVRSQVN